MFSRSHFLVLALVAVACASAAPVPAIRVTAPLDAGWRFALGDPASAEKPAFNDASWRNLNVPHDWSIEGPFAATNKTGGPGGFLPAGIGWYRQAFTLSAVAAPRRIFVEFDGVMANSDVWINGFHLGKRPFGYVSFRYELTGHLKFGLDQTNVLAVRADNSVQPASRWYSGAGIYRHVRLIETEPVHIDQWGTFVTTPQVSAAQAVVHILSVVTNQSDSPREVIARWTLLSPISRALQTLEAPAQTIPAGGSATFQQEFPVKNPQLWDLEHPNLYQVRAEIRAAGAALDDEVTTFGIRDAHFEPDTGFWLNGKNFKLKGVCLHHDGGAFGAAVPLGVWERRLELLRQFGCNAIRTAHNPPAPEFLALCDRMGFLVMDELFDCWTVGKGGLGGEHLADYHLYFNEWSKIDLRDTVRRDRNHPCIIVYSAGNEIHDTPNGELAKRILKGLVEVFHENDPSRPVTQALFRPNVSHDYDNGLADLLDVVGQNYRENEILAAHAQKPSRKILGTENGHDRTMWLALRDHAPYAGQFLWTGIDYLGESRRWPAIGAGSGLYDRTGTPRARGFERQSWWSDQPMVRIVRRIEPARTTPADPGFEPLSRRQLEFPDWTPRNTAPHDETVEVLSNCEQVELFLNSKSLGVQALPADASPRTWRIPFVPGLLKAEARNKGRQVATQELRTAGQPAGIRLVADRTKLTPDWDDVICVRVQIVDEAGTPVPDASNLVTFNLTGPGVIAAVDNGDNTSHESFQASARQAFQGRCVAFLKATAATGRINLTATAANLYPASVIIKLIEAHESR